MSTIEMLMGKKFEEMSTEELTEVVRTRRRDMTAIMEGDVVTIGIRTHKKKSSGTKVDITEDML